MNEARNRATGGEPLTSNRRESSIMAVFRFKHPIYAVKSLAVAAVRLLRDDRTRLVRRSHASEARDPALPIITNQSSPRLVKLSAAEQPR
jgi:hypothetical protein